MPDWDDMLGGKSQAAKDRAAVENANSLRSLSQFAEVDPDLKRSLFGGFGG